LTSAIEQSSIPIDFLQIDHAVKRFPIGQSGFWSSRFRKGSVSRFVSAVDDVSLSVSKGETLVILGESGSGKTTLGRMIVGLERLDGGSIQCDSEQVSYVRDRGAKRGRLQMVFQDPGSSLDPFVTVSDCVGEPITKTGLKKSEIAGKVNEALHLVGLEGQLVSRRTIELSGGQKQRVSIARAIISDPKVIVLDEPTSSIDVSIQAQVLNLLVDLQEMKNLTYVLISHDPNVARFMADYIAVMHLGKVVEYGPVSTVLSSPKHPYTKTLLASAPKLGAELPSEAAKEGDPQSMIVLPTGCRYEPRCKFAMKICKEKPPVLLSLKEDEKTLVSCFLYGD
jgi:peptide/nickel transport system ATP-binding protein